MSSTNRNPNCSNASSGSAARPIRAKRRSPHCWPRSTPSRSTTSTATRWPTSPAPIHTCTRRCGRCTRTAWGRRSAGSGRRRRRWPAPPSPVGASACQWHWTTWRTCPATSTIIAEGPGFFPAVIAPLLPDLARAIWLVPTEAFKRASVERRNKLRGVPVSDHARAVENLTQRDLLLGEAIVASARALGLTFIEINGAETIAEVAVRIEMLFAPFFINTNVRSE